jgi:cell wall-associated NlpC family hydrolase
MSTMMAVAASADLETYSNWDTWGTPGFCWYNNDVEDGVSEEGVDCSGLVAKVWYLNRLSGYSTNGSYYYWSPTFYSRTIYISSTTFASGASNASWTARASGTGRLLGDAVAEANHHVFLYVQDLPGGKIKTIEAFGHTAGKDVGYFTHRAYADYDTEWEWTRRKGVAP